MKVKKGKDIREISPMNLAVWRSRGYVEYKPKPKKEAPAGEAEARPRKRSKKGTKAKPA